MAALARVERDEPQAPAVAVARRLLDHLLTSGRLGAGDALAGLRARLEALLVAQIARLGRGGGQRRWGDRHQPGDRLIAGPVGAPHDRERARRTTYGRMPPLWR